MHFLFCYRVDNAIVGASTFHLQLSPAASNSVGLNSPNFFAAKLFVYREYVTAFVKFKKKKQPLVTGVLPLTPSFCADDKCWTRVCFRHRSLDFFLLLSAPCESMYQL